MRSGNKFVRKEIRPSENFLLPKAVYLWYNAL